MKTLHTICAAIALMALSLNSTAQTDDNATAPETSTLCWQAVYPVPVISLLTLRVNSPDESLAVLRLIDVLGRTAFERPICLYTGSNSFELNMNDMAAGLYQLVLQTNNKRIVYKLLKAQ